MRYCKNCKMFVKPKDHFSFFWFIILLIPFVLFLWLIYLFYCYNKDKDHICPRCNSKTLKSKPIEPTHPVKRLIETKQTSRIRQSSTKNSKVCSYCGDRIKEDLKYCNHCGSKQFVREINDKERKELLEKIREMLEVSNRIKLDMMRDVLKMDKSTFNSKIFGWARQFEFIIDGDYLNVNKEMVSDFIDELDRKFDVWRKDGEEGTDKV